MSTAPRHLEFAPPPTPGFLRALGLAILAHGVLLAVLTVGVQWKRQAVQQRFEAELWGAVPTEAAPPPVPEPPKPLAPEPKPDPKPAPPDTTKAQADIALQKEKEKAKELLEKKLALEKAELEKKKQEELEKQKLAKLEQEKKDKLEKLRKEQEAKDSASLAKTREEQLKRMERLAGSGNGSPNATGTAQESRALSSSYAGRIRSYIKRFLIYTEAINGNPTTEIEVRLASDGSILSRRITKPSGTKGWDDAALNAIDKAEKLPLDENGRAPSPMTIIWSAQEVTR